ncbi:MAG: cell division ATPase MinD [Candidatus Aenigmarchaeota archaeon]|nr:cell division ATPase MinD [Candidatus Aenigmarchaeota archaeon]
MTRVIGILSAKGGAGKTTVVSNLGVQLALIGKSVVMVDANITTPNLGFHMGMPLTPVTLHDVMKGRASIRRAMYRHDSGAYVIPAGISLKDLRGIDPRDFPSVLNEIIGTTDFILLDGAAGLGREAMATIEASDELLIVTNPDITAVTDALKAIKLAEQLGTQVRGVIINRATGKSHHLSAEDVRNILEADILAEIPEDVFVQKAIYERTPVVQYRPNRQSSQEFKKVAHTLSGEYYKPKNSFLSWIFNR